MYTLPLIIWYPMQVVVGTMVVPRLQAFIRNETARLAGTEADESLDDDDDDVEFAEGYGDDLERGNLSMETEEVVCRLEEESSMPWSQAAVIDVPETESIEDGVVDEPVGELVTVPLESSEDLRVDNDES